jgi:hypothetical protein
MKKIDESKYSEDQLYWLREGIKSGRDISLMEDTKFTPGQMHEIYDGLIDGQDVSGYAKTYYHQYRMAMIREAIKRNKRNQYDITPLFNDSFDYDQIKFLCSEVRGGIGDRIKLINNPNLSIEQMKQVLKDDEEERKDKEERRKQRVKFINKQENEYEGCDCNYSISFRHGRFQNDEDTRYSEYVYGK